eukprot:1940800-Amphidinium_carterae.1
MSFLKNHGPRLKRSRKLFKSLGSTKNSQKAALDPHEDDYIEHYHTELTRLLELQGDTPPSLAYLTMMYSIAMADLYRWTNSGPKA